MLLNIIFGLALMILGYLLMPKPAQPKTEPSEMESPTAEAGRVIPFLMGDMTLKAPNFLGWWDKQYKNLEDDSGDKKK